MPSWRQKCLQVQYLCPTHSVIALQIYFRMYFLEWSGLILCRNKPDCSIFLFWLEHSSQWCYIPKSLLPNRSACVAASSVLATQWTFSYFFLLFLFVTLGLSERCRRCPAFRGTPRLSLSVSAVVFPLKRYVDLASTDVLFYVFFSDVEHFDFDLKSLCHCLWVSARTRLSLSLTTQCSSHVHQERAPVAYSYFTKGHSRPKSTPRDKFIIFFLSLPHFIYVVSLYELI